MISTYRSPYIHSSGFDFCKRRLLKLTGLNRTMMYYLTELSLEFHMLSHFLRISTKGLRAKQAKEIQQTLGFV